MRHTIYILLIVLLPVSLLLSSCGKDDTATPPVDPVFKGDFVSAAHNTKGIASIDQGETTLTLTNFKTDSGPDLNIYLAKNLTNVTSDYIDLGDIKGVNGNYDYALPGSADYTEYKYVIVWCVAFDVNFGYAELVEQ
jgi:hypothetical protein